MEKVSVILPTFNEKDNIIRLINSLRKIVNPLEIIVVDDNSPDKTADIVEKSRLKKVKIIRRTQRGVGSAIYAGIKAAKGDIIVWMDADLSMPPELVPKMVSALRNNDVAVGSRYAKGGKDKRDPLRVVTSRFINLFANIILNFKVLDYDSGFVAAKRYVFDKAKFDPKGHGEYCIEFLFKCTKKGFKIKEIPYTFTERKLGESKTSQYIYSIFKYGFMYVLRVLSLRFKKNL